LLAEPSTFGRPLDLSPRHQAQFYTTLQKGRERC
jgi:hypothetical protein